ncbi:Wzz/FepE/Etk N-terminal domain-containing protein, partial [uncultured Cloacibacillus sp.]|uniref:Wzz/FepE/Etk N-terminal domain-containing protein n=1 Tax=uncultured Cloacibacillus sp. TaxID=889794 RepID=UPI0025F14F04
MEQRTNMEMFQDECEELSLLDIVIVLAEQKKLIAAVTLIFALAGLAYALLFTKPEYKSEIQMMTVNSRITGDGELSVYLPGNMIDAVVSSNAMRDAVISEFNLTNVDGKEISKDAAQRSLEKNVGVSIGKSGLVTISVKSPSPEQSMKMAD